MSRFSLLAFIFVGLSIGFLAWAQEGADGSNAGANGIFTEEQAKRGQQAYFQNCASCHGMRLNGGMGPALTGASFMASRGSDTVQKLFDYTKANMPLGLGGSLDDSTYADIIAFVLSNNGHAPGDSELAAQSEAMAETRVDPAAE